MVRHIKAKTKRSESVRLQHLHAYAHTHTQSIKQMHSEGLEKKADKELATCQKVIAILVMTG